MELDWKKIKEGYRGFEKLAVSFIDSQDSSLKNKWEKTKDTRDRNHDAVLLKEKNKSMQDVSLFIGYATEKDIWWMEAKYSRKNSGTISRYRLDATIVTALSQNTVSKIIFITNLDIGSKAISDIRKAIRNSSKCNEVLFYTKPHLEYWLLQDNYSVFKDYFEETYEEYISYNLPWWYCNEEITFYHCSDIMFEDPLDILYTRFSYKIRFSIFSNKAQAAEIFDITNIIMEDTSQRKLHLRKGLNPIEITINIPNNIEEENTTSKDIIGDAVGTMPVILKIVGENNSILEITSLSSICFIDSKNYFLDIPEQGKIEKEVVNDVEKYITKPLKEFSLSVLSGKSGVGKSFVVDRAIHSLYSIFTNLLIYKVSFSGNIDSDLILIKEGIFNLFFPFLDYRLLDKKYIQTLRKNNTIFQDEFWDLIDPSQDIDGFIHTLQSEKHTFNIFPNEKYVKNIFIVFDDYHKLNQILKSPLEWIFSNMRILKYKIYYLIVAQTAPTTLFANGYLVNYLKNFYLELKSDDIKTVLKRENIDVDIIPTEILFSSTIELISFIKYIKENLNKISTQKNFEFLYHAFLQSDILKNELYGEFNRVFTLHPNTQTLCSNIYYYNPGVPFKKVSENAIWKENIGYLLQEQLVKKDAYDYYVPWHDYYRWIYQSLYKFQTDNNFKSKTNTISELKESFQTFNFDMQKEKDKLDNLFRQQKFFSLYYVLENIFSTNEQRCSFRERITEADYFYLFGIYCYANTNCGYIYSGYEKFKEMYDEMTFLKEIQSKCIKYIILFELLNSSYESGRFEEALGHYKKIQSISKSTINNWENVYGWDYKILMRSAYSIALLIKAEKGEDISTQIKNLNCREKYQEKDLAFIIYRLLLANLTNNFYFSSTLLLENEKYITNDIIDQKTCFMYNFSTSFLKCIKNEVEISDVITANNLLKQQYQHDYNRHIFAISALAFYKKEPKYVDVVFWEYIKTERKLKDRQNGFKEAVLALLELNNSNVDKAIGHLTCQLKYMKEYKTYLPVIEHNLNGITSGFIKPKGNVDFYYGNKFKEKVYYFDIRILY